ncbi:hypothetical protein ACIRBX_16640 [Kitasatospora sp. NPDC096147]
MIVANAGSGRAIAFRHSPAERRLDFVVTVRSDESAQPYHAAPTAPR